MGITGGVYRFFFLLHMVGIMGGFGPTIVAPFFGAQARARPGREGAAIAEATFDVLSRYGLWFIYSVPISGILLVLTSDDAWKFSQAWISLAFLLYIVALGLVHAVHYPNLRRMNQLMAELAAATGPPSGGATAGRPPQLAELEERGKRVSAVGGLLHLLLVVILILMIWKPGA